MELEEADERQTSQKPPHTHRRRERRSDEPIRFAVAGQATAVSRTQLHSSATLPFEDGILPPARPASKRLSLMTAWLRATRPRQWTKNLLVFAAPAAAGSMTQPSVIVRSVVAFFAFVAASASTYLVNDVVDRENDQLHPVKKNRPVASGQVSVGLALWSAAGLASVALVTAALVSGAALVGVITAYLAISVLYSVTLKRVPLVELACVAAGFALRAVAGGAVAHVTISPWFLMVASFGSLLIVAGKRSVEQAELKDRRGTAPFGTCRIPGGVLEKCPHAGHVGHRDDVLPLGLRACRTARAWRPRRGHCLVRAVDHPLRARRPRR